MSVVSYDAAYEFDCPKFVDLNAVSGDAVCDADEWFHHRRYATPTARRTAPMTDKENQHDGGAYTNVRGATVSTSSSACVSSVAPRKSTPPKRSAVSASVVSSECRRPRAPSRARTSVTSDARTALRSRTDVKPQNRARVGPLPLPLPLPLPIRTNAPLTVPKPFTLATEARARTQASTVTATVIPPRTSALGVTAPAPFHLRVDVLGAAKAAKFQERTAAIRAREQSARAFHARPLPLASSVLSATLAPADAGIFIPRKVRVVTAPITVALNSTARAVERSVFDAERRESERATAARHQSADAAERAMNDDAVRALRRTLIHRALPMPIPKSPFVPRNASAPLTVPLTPQLATDKRAKMRSAGAVVPPQLTSVSVQQVPPPAAALPATAPATVAVCV